ncbi:hypothetical protein AURDEDRAFT_187695 [Auricularia subglabra TFB-10046 SS5]|nr:hypothetical protein AURDEDRAFT_187695 [Auricularia subglabra TFB-10046 SS5]
MALAPHHHRALATGIESVLLDALRDVSGAGDAQKIVRAVELAALNLIASVADRWNLQSTVPWLPPEVLTSCFLHLPFQDLVSATHVSRYWRSAALAAPGLWSRVQLKPFAAIAEALSEVLGRSRARPVDLTLRQPGKESMRDVEHVLSSHMHHMRTISCTLAVSGPVFLPSAPLLEMVKLAPHSGTPIAELPPSFLGGFAPRLRELHLENFVLLEACPTLASVTRFSGVLARWAASNVDRLFDLCPNLSSLRLENIQNSTQLPLGRVPPTLSDVELIACEGWSVDFSRHLSAWSDSNIARISLQGCASSLDLSTYFSGIELRTLKIDSVLGRRFVVDAADDAGTSRRVDVSFAFASTREVSFPILPPLLPLFSGLWSLGVPSALFNKMLDEEHPWRLPELKTLRLTVFHPLSASGGVLEVPKLDLLEVHLEKHAILDVQPLRRCVHENLGAHHLRRLEVTGFAYVDSAAAVQELAGIAREILVTAV